MPRNLHSALSAIPLLASLALGQGALQGTLSQAAAKAGLNIGIATATRQLTGTYGETAKTHFNLLVCENDMKFQSTEPSRGRFSYTGGDGVYNWGKTNGLRLRGHTFVWHSQSGWASSLNGSREEMLSVIKTHIDSVGGHFKGKVIEWDVLNEITNDGGSGGNNGLRASFWQKAIGNDFPDSAFAYARRADPYARLYYNDYGGDGVNSKSTTMHNLAKKWIENKIPIDGIGLQCHLSSPVNKQSISDNIKRFGELGLRISLTEIDIKNGTTQDWTNLMSACLENFNCTSFVTWGIYDGASWLGQGCNCLLFTESWQPKAAVQSLIDLMNNANPDIVAKRKDFAKEPIIPTLVIPRKPQARAARGGFVLSAAGVPLFSDGVGAVDALGRDRPVAPHSSWAEGLSVTAR